MRNRLVAKVVEHRSRVSELERELMVLSAELRAYEDALEMWQEDNGAPSVSSASAERSHAPARKARGLSGAWVSVLRDVGERHPAPFGIDGILGVSEAHGLTPTRGNVRSQMASFVGRGLIERVSNGEFRLTVKGLAELGIREMPAQSGPRQANEATDPPLPKESVDLVTTNYAVERGEVEHEKMTA